MMTKEWIMRGERASYEPGREAAPDQERRAACGG